MLHPFHELISTFVRIEVLLSRKHVVFPAIASTVGQGYREWGFCKLPCDGWWVCLGCPLPRAFLLFIISVTHYFLLLHRLMSMSHPFA